MIRVDNLLYDFFENKKNFQNITTFKGSNRSIGLRNKLIIPPIYVENKKLTDLQLLLFVNLIEDLSLFLDFLIGDFNCKSRVEFKGYYIDLYFGKFEFNERNLVKKEDSYISNCKIAITKK